jgi:hypothetical protein
MQINLPEKYTDLYIRALQEKKKSLLERIRQFQYEIEEIDQHLNSLTSLPLFGENQTPLMIDTLNNQYQVDWSWTRKIAYYQDIKKKLFKASEVVDYIAEKEPSVNKSKIRSSVSAALSNKSKQGAYRKFIDPVTEQTYYGPPKFFLNKGEPHMEFMPEELKERLLYNK